VDVRRFPQIVCQKSHRQERATVIKRLREGKSFLFCEECGEKISLPEVEKPLALGAHDSHRIHREEALARLRSAYETYLVRVKGFRRDRAAPRCYISHAPEQAYWAVQLTRDLRDAGAYVLEEQTQLEEHDFVILVAAPTYRRVWDSTTDSQLIRARLRSPATARPTIIPLLLEGELDVLYPRELHSIQAGDFRDVTHYAVGLFDLVLTLYAIPFNHPAFETFRESLRQQWEQTLLGLADEKTTDKMKPSEIDDTAEDQYQLRELLNIKQRRLKSLELQAARLGASCPPEITLEIEDLRREIGGLRKSA
jgi:hypothetical protein